jgi:hypothetical protein
MQETYKLGLAREPPKSSLSERCWGYSPLPRRGERGAHGVSGCHSWARVSAIGGGAACGRVRFDAVYEKEMVQPLENVHD